MNFSWFCVIALGLLHAILSERKEEEEDNVMSVLSREQFQAKLIPPAVRQAFEKALAKRWKAIKDLQEQEKVHQEAVTAQGKAATERQQALAHATQVTNSLAQQEATTIQKEAASKAAGRQATAAETKLGEARAALQQQEVQITETQREYAAKFAEKERLMQQYEQALQDLEAKIDQARQDSEQAKLQVERAELESRAAGELKEQERKADAEAREQLRILTKKHEQAREEADARESELQETNKVLKKQKAQLGEAKLKQAEETRLYELIKGVRSSISSRSSNAGKSPGVDVAFGDVIAVAEEYENERMNSETPWLVFLEKVQKELEGAAKAYNYFVAASTLIRDIDPEIYASCLEADAEIRERGLNDIKVMCLQGRDVSEELADEHCGSGLWKQLDVSLDVMPAPLTEAEMQAKAADEVASGQAKVASE